MKTDQRPRHIIMTDIGGDPDDEQCLIRFLVWSDCFRVEGIIPSHWAGGDHTTDSDGQMTLVRKYLEAYSQVEKNLRQHSSGYPTAAHLRSVLKRGAVRLPFALDTGRVSRADAEALLGEGHDTEGSQWIEHVVDRDDATPVDISVWGGTADLAQALWRVRETRTRDEAERFASRIRVHAISDQDATGPWIRNQFPSLFYIFNHSPDGDKWHSCYRGMFVGGDLSLTSRDWIDEHVRTGHGPLGALYPTRTATGPNPHGCLKEGDAPAWFHFLQNGLNVPSHPEYGGWGGRFERDDPNRNRVYRDAIDRIGDDADGTVTTWRWRPAFQNHFAARMDRCVRSPQDVSTPPLAFLEGQADSAPVTREVAAGSPLTLSAEGSCDPQGTAVVLQWWIYREAGTADVSEGTKLLPHADHLSTTLSVPASAPPGSSIHVILEVTNSSDPPLTSYRRAIVRVE